MAETRIDLYEGMFLLHQGASAEFGECLDHLKQVFERAEAELVHLRKWDERKLAYPIGGQRRGIYMLAYFRARRSQLANIERDCNLSEKIIRAMMLRADHLGEAELGLILKEATADDEARLREERPREEARQQSARVEKVLPGEESSPPPPRETPQTPDAVQAPADGKPEASGEESASAASTASTEAENNTAGM